MNQWLAWYRSGTSVDHWQADERLFDGRGIVRSMALVTKIEREGECKPEEVSNDETTNQPGFGGLVKFLEMKTKLETLEELIEDEFWLRSGCLTSKSRKEPTVTGRHCLTYILHKVVGMNLRQVAELTNRVDVGSVCHSTKTFKLRLETEPGTEIRLNNVLDRFKQKYGDI